MLPLHRTGCCIERKKKTVLSPIKKTPSNASVSEGFDAFESEARSLKIKSSPLDSSGMDRSVVLLAHPPADSRVKVRSLGEGSNESGRLAAPFVILKHVQVGVGAFVCREKTLSDVKAETSSTPLCRRKRLITGGLWGVNSPHQA